MTNRKKIITSIRYLILWLFFLSLSPPIFIRLAIYKSSARWSAGRQGNSAQFHLNSCELETTRGEGSQWHYSWLPYSHSGTQRRGNIIQLPSPKSLPPLLLLSGTILTFVWKIIKIFRNFPNSLKQTIALWVIFHIELPWNFQYTPCQLLLVNMY